MWLTDTIFCRNFQHLPHYPIFLDKKLQTYSVQRTEHFCTYFGYIRRLFPRLDNPFKLTGRSRSGKIKFWNWQISPKSRYASRQVLPKNQIPSDRAAESTKFQRLRLRLRLRIGKIDSDSNSDSNSDSDPPQSLFSHVEEQSFKTVISSLQCLWCKILLAN